MHKRTSTAPIASIARPPEPSTPQPALSAAPAAGGVGLVITAYEQRTRPGQLQVDHSKDLTPALYRELRQPWPGGIPEPGP